VALGVAGGYFLGRTKKMKVALMLGGMAAGRRAGGPTELLAQGAKLLGQSPELTRLTEEIRGRLLEAGKGAAMAVATRQVESLTDRVGKRVESLGDLGGEVGQKSGQEPEQDANDEYDEPADEAAGYDDQDDDRAPRAEGDAAASGDRGEEELPSGSSSTADQSSPARSGAAVNSNAAAAILKRTANATTSGTPAQRARPARPRPAARAGGPARARRSGSDD
jgi:hypothetical protein